MAEAVKQCLTAAFGASGDPMVTWKDFAAAESDLADVGRSLLFQFKVGLAFLATVRKDGAPRLHPVCPVLSTDRLFVLITSASPKRHDLLRDGRYALQTFPQPKPGSDEFYVAGKAILVEDPAVRAAVFRDAKHMAEASEVLFELWIERVMHTRWENVLTPQMRPVHQKWRAPRAAGSAYPAHVAARLLLPSFSAPAAHAQVRRKLVGTREGAIHEGDRRS